MAGNNVKRTMFLKMVIGSFLRRKTRLAIIVLSIMLASSMVTAIMSVYFDINTKMKKELRTYGANVVITPQNDSKLSSEELDKVLNFFEKDKIFGFSPYLYGFVDSGNHRFVISGMIPGQLKKLSPYVKVKDGSVKFRTGQAVVGRNLAEKLSVKTGDKVTLSIEGRESTVAVKGLIETGSVEDDQIIAPIEDVRKLLAIGDAQIAYLSYTGDHEEILKNISSANRKVPDIKIKPINQISKSEGSILNKISGLTLLVSVVIFISTIFSVAMTLMALVFERKREIGLKKAIGAPNKSIIKEFAGESIVIGVIGGLIGWIVGLLMAQLVGKNIFDAYISIRMVTLPLAIGSSLTIALVSSILPIRMAIAIHPAIVLKDE